MKKAAKGGVMVKLNGNLAVQKNPGSNGVGNTKNQKATKQTVPGGKSPGGVNTPVSVSPKAMYGGKMKKGGSVKKSAKKK